MTQSRPMFRLYEGWSDDLRASELATLDHLDSTAWFRTVAALLKTDDVAPIKMALGGSSGSDTFFLREPVGNECLTIRLLRYLSSEQLLALLLSAQNHLPYARFASKMRYQELTQVYDCIGQGVVPDRFSVLGGNIQAFEPWLSLKLGDWNAGALCPTLVRFIKDEARFLSDRTFINAIKHGRARTHIDASMIALYIEFDGDWSQIIPPKNAIWVEDWTEGPGGFSHVVHGETFDYKAEIGALHVAHLLMTAIINSRVICLKFLTSEEDSCRVDFSLPCDINFSAAVSRIKGLPTMSGAVE